MKILVIEARGLPAGFLGCYGNEWVGTPAIDRLAAQGVVFDAHIAATPDVNGVKPTFDNVGLESPTYVRIDNVIGFGAAALAAWGRAPESGIVWIDGPNLAPPWSLPGGLLSSYCEHDIAEEDLAEEDIADDDDDADQDAAEEPWPDPPRGVRPVTTDELLRLHNTFAAVMTYFDAQLGALFEDMEGGAEALICVTARCGLNLGEHGLVGPQRAWLHEELVHIPLVMRLPGNRDAGRRIAALTQPMDLLPGLVELLTGERRQQRGFMPLLEGEVEAIRPHACSALTVGASAELALRTPDWALLVPASVPADDPPRGPQLYVKPDDRWEVNDARHQHVELAEELEATLRAHHETANLAGTLHPPLPTGGAP